LDTIPYDFIIAATDYHSYNSLVCTTFMPEYGRTNVFKVDPNEDESTQDNIVAKGGGRSLLKEEISLAALNDKVNAQYVFRQTTLTEKFTYKNYLADKEAEANLLYFSKPAGQLYFYTLAMRMTPHAGDVVVSLTPPHKEQEKMEKKKQQNKNSSSNNE